MFIACSYDFKTTFLWNNKTNQLYLLAMNRIQEIELSQKIYRKGYCIRDQEAIYFLTFQIVGWIDIFTRSKYKDIIVDSLNYCCSNKQLKVHAWVIMSNHVHCIISSTNGKLSDTIRDLKRHTSKTILNAILNENESRKDWMINQFKYFASRHKRNELYQFWTHENHPIELQGSLIKQRLNYVHNNPVRANIVAKPEDYLYSSALDYSGEKGFVPIEFLY